MDSFFAWAEKAQQSFEQQQAFCTHGSCSVQHKNSGPTPHRYMPYEKDTDKGKTADSFWDNKKLILCLCCGYTGHWAGNCMSNQSNCPEQPITCDWKHENLISKSNKVICVLFNIQGSCNDPLTNHGGHFCSLCSDSSHPMCRCPRN